MAKILIMGCGAIGTQLANELSAQGHAVTGLKRQPPVTADNINYIAADITSAADIASIGADFDYVFFILSADGRTEQSYRAIYETGLRNALSKFSRPSWFFVSSTSVYGQEHGEWVDEDSLAQPDSITGRLIRQAESQVMALNTQNVVVRFSGIYGPGREHLLKMARQAPPIQKQPPYFTNRIHQRDCVGVLAFLLAQRLAGKALQQCYLASDDDPAPLWEVVSWLAEHMQCPPPVETAGSARNKRCNNQRLKTLGYRFYYPSYQDGYRDLLNSYSSHE